MYHVQVHKTDEMVVGNALTALQILCSFNQVLFVSGIYCYVLFENMKI